MTLQSEGRGQRAEGRGQRAGSKGEDRRTEVKDLHSQQMQPYIIQQIMQSRKNR